MIELTDLKENEDLGFADGVLEFYSPSCMPCRKMMTILENLEKEVEEDILFFKIDATESPNLVKRFGVMSLPTIIVLQGGIVEEKFTGLVSKSAIMGALE